jgi:hypothetical protein
VSQEREILFGGAHAGITQSPQARNALGESTPFGGGPATGSTLSIEVPDPSGELKWYQIIEQALFQLTSTEEGRAKYGDPNKGATLEQAWRAQFLVTGCNAVCILASERPSVPTAGIPKTVLMPTSQLVQTLARAYASLPRLGVQTFVFDGRVGHCITLLDHDPSTSSFVYHDPWPGRSLLCSENNAAGVAATATDKGYWRITESELRLVIFAIFLWPSEWAELTGTKYKVPYPEFEKSEFWSFFNLHEQLREESSGTSAVVHLKTGGFSDEIQLKVTLDELDVAERILSATLSLRRAWIMGEPWGVNPFALDITKSFLEALAPDPDRSDFQPLIEGLWALRSPEDARALIAQGKNSPAVNQLLSTYVGGQAESNIFMAFSHLAINNVEREGEPWLTLDLTLW